MVTGMSYGALRATPRPRCRAAPGWPAPRPPPATAACWTSSGTESRVMIYEVLPSRYGINVRHLRQADAIELTIGQGAKPGTGGLLLGSKVSARSPSFAICPPASTSAALPPSRFPRPRRHGDQDRGAARGDRLAGADLRQDGRLARLRRRQAGRQGRRRRDRGRRHGRRHRRSPDCSRSTPASPRWPRSARRGRHSRTSACTARCSSSSPAASATAPTAPRPWPWAPTPSTWAPPSDRAELQQAALCRGLPRHRRRPVFLPPLPYRPLPGRHHDAGPGADRPARSRPRGRARGQLLPRA